MDRSLITTQKNEEYPKKPVVAFLSFPYFANKTKQAKLNRIINTSLTIKSMLHENKNLICVPMSMLKSPLSLKGTNDYDPVKIEGIDYNVSRWAWSKKRSFSKADGDVWFQPKLDYHTGGVLASLADCITSPYRQRNQRNYMNELLDLFDFKSYKVIRLNFLWQLSTLSWLPVSFSRSLDCKPLYHWIWAESTCWITCKRENPCAKKQRGSLLTHTLWAIWKRSNAKAPLTFAVKEYLMIESKSKILRAFEDCNSKRIAFATVPNRSVSIPWPQPQGYHISTVSIFENDTVAVRWQYSTGTVQVRARTRSESWQYLVRSWTWDGLGTLAKSIVLLYLTLFIHFSMKDTFVFKPVEKAETIVEYYFKETYPKSRRYSVFISCLPTTASHRPFLRTVFRIARQPLWTPARPSQTSS